MSIQRFALTTAFLLSLVALSACGKTTTVDEPIGTEIVPVIFPQQGKAVHPKFGKEVWFAYGAMTGTKTTPANGVVQAYKFENGMFVVTMQLNVAIEQDGTFYEAWLKEASGSFLSMGHLQNHFGDVRHQLTFEFPEDIAGNTDVVVTLEKDDGNPAPDQTVATGVLKPTVR
ncbi:MAG: anti-sigma factor [Candidatus Peregrinibacteria bacterium]